MKNENRNKDTGAFELNDDILDTVNGGFDAQMPGDTELTLLQTRAQQLLQGSSVSSADKQILMTALRALSGAVGGVKLSIPDLETAICEIERKYVELT